MTDAEELKALRKEIEELRQRIVLLESARIVYPVPMPQSPPSPATPIPWLPVIY